MLSFGLIYIYMYIYMYNCITRGKWKIIHLKVLRLVIYLVLTQKKKNKKRNRALVTRIEIGISNV